MRSTITAVFAVLCDACDWPFFLKKYMIVSGLKNKVKFLTKNSNDTCSQWITIETAKQTEDGGKRLVIHYYIQALILSLITAIVHTFFLMI